MEHQRNSSLFGKLVRAGLAVVGAVALTLGLFLVLPLLQAISDRPRNESAGPEVDVGALPPPPPPPPMDEEEPPEEEEEEEPPEMLEEAPPLDLAELELALSGGTGDGWGTADYTLNLQTLGGGGGGDVNQLFSLADLDQKPRVVYRPNPVISAKLRKRAPGTVHVAFEVNEQGRVEDPRVLESTDPIFERVALNSIKKWKFEPGKKNGTAVRFRMRVPFTIPKS
ncbi:MAG: energy transducer TonB [Planctomycetota bacterium]